MSLFGLGKDKQKEEANPSVMAYIEDAMMLKSPAMIIDGRKNEIPCGIMSLQEPSGTLQLQLHANLLAEKGSKVTFIIVIDNMRIGGTSKLHEVKPGNAVIDIPDSFEIMERRKKQRARVNPREGTTCTILSGLFDGIGITGLAENLSETGARVKVENALEIKTEKKINVTGRTLPTGQIFPIVKITKIPRVVVTLECGGKLIYTQVTGGSSYIGVSFEEMKSEFARTIDNFVSGRSSPMPTSLPPRARRQREAPVDMESKHSASKKEEDAKEGGKKEAKEAKSTADASKHSEPSHKSAPAPEAKPSPAHVPDEAVAQAHAVTETAAEAKAATPPDSHADGAPNDLKRPAPTPLQKLKRKARTVVLFGTEEETITRLEEILHEEGYGKVICPQGMEELLESAPQNGAGIILLDMNLPFEQCLAIAGSILSYVPDKLPLIMVSESSQINVGATLDAQKAGVSLLLPRPLKIDNALFNKLEELMGITG